MASVARSPDLTSLDKGRLRSFVGFLGVYIYVYVDMCMSAELIELAIWKNKLTKSNPPHASGVP